jgi:hypothetical protein
MSSVLCQAWQKQVQEFFTQLHGHQSKTLAWFVLGAIRARSLVLSQIAEALLAESEAKASSIERRLERFLSNPRIDVEQSWEALLAAVMPFFRQKPMRIIIDVPRMKNMPRSSTWVYSCIRGYCRLSGK